MPKETRGDLQKMKWPLTPSPTAPRYTPVDGPKHTEVKIFYLVAKSTFSFLWRSRETWEKLPKKSEDEIKQTNFHLVLHVRSNQAISSSRIVFFQDKLENNDLKTTSV